MTTNLNKERFSDEVFIRKFENQALLPDEFKHRDHLRLTWLYLATYDLETTVQKACYGIKVYAESLGAGKKFHLTITDSIVRIMAQRVDKMEKKEWELFLNQNRDLVDDAISVLLQYFSRDLLFSEKARTSLIQPDLKPI